MSGADDGSHVAVITGGGTGIGRAASFELARDGYAVLVADLDARSAQAVTAEIEMAGGMSASIACDVSSERSWSRIIECAASLGRLTALVSNAAVYPRLPFAETTIDDFDRVFAVNLRSAFLGVSYCVPVLRGNGGGAVVMMTSGSGLPEAASNPMQRGFSLYGASKAALDRWAQGIAPELAPSGIAINLLCPGAMVKTDGTARLDWGDDAPATTIGAERVAQAIAHLAGLRPPDETGRRYVATEFGKSWGVR